MISWLKQCFTCLRKRRVVVAVLGSREFRGVKANCQLSHHF